MKVRDVMSGKVVTVAPGESVEVAARTLAQYNIGVLPVCSNGQLKGLITDRDLVTRCLAANRSPATTTVEQVMSDRLVTVGPDTDVCMAAHLMGSRQVRRLPVVDGERLCGMVSLKDLAVREETSTEAADALSDISSNIC